MTDAALKPTKKQQISVSLAYVAYLGENLIKQSPDGQSVPAKILGLIDEAMPRIPPLCDSSGKVDWQVVWGPTTYTFPLAILQDNMMFVANQISKPSNYVVAVRGTNALALLDWVEEDLRVWEKVAWAFPPGKTAKGKPKISQGTGIGLDALLHKMTPLEGIPGYPHDITEFLGKIAKRRKIEVLFTGHSLGGALSPTLALWFKQSQHIQGEWDPRGNATISAIPFAGPTAGDSEFADYFNSELGDACDRIHNTIDAVPNTFEGLKELPGLYASARIEMPRLLSELVELMIKTVKGYKQVERSCPFTFTIDPAYDNYASQAAYQHLASYPEALGVPSLLEVIGPVKNQLKDVLIVDGLVSHVHGALRKLRDGLGLH